MLKFVPTSDQARETRTQRLSDGRRIGYAEYGDPEGRVVFACHGTPGCRLMFRLADEPARRRGLRLIAPDRPGYGLSSACATSSAYGVARMGRRPQRGLCAGTRDMLEIAEALWLERFAIVGVSGGGPYATACAATLKERVTRLALVSPIGPVSDTSLELAPLHDFIFRRVSASPWASVLTFQSMRLMLARMPTLCHRGILQRAALADRAVLLRPEVRACLLESLYEGLRHGVQGAREDLRLFGQPWDFDPSQIMAPACIWIGSADTVVPITAVERLAASIPDCDLRRIDGAGHYWVFRHFEEVLDWLVGQDATIAQ